MDTMSATSCCSRNKTRTNRTTKETWKGKLLPIKIVQNDDYKLKTPAKLFNCRSSFDSFFMKPNSTQGIRTNEQNKGKQLRRKTVIAFDSVEDEKVDLEISWRMKLQLKLFPLAPCNLGHVIMFVTKGNDVHKLCQFTKKSRHNWNFRLSLNDDVAHIMYRCAKIFFCNWINR